MKYLELFRSSINAGSIVLMLLFSPAAYPQAAESDNERSSSRPAYDPEAQSDNRDRSEQAGSPLAREFFYRLAAQKSVLESDSPDAELGHELILGERTLRSLIYEMELAEATAYNIYNVLNASDEFDLACKRETSGDNPIPEQVCLPAFLEQYVEATGSVDRAIRQSVQLFEQLNEELANLSEQNEDLAFALVYRATLQKELDGMLETDLDDMDFITAVRMGLVEDANTYASLVGRGSFNQGYRRSPLMGRYGAGNTFGRSGSSSPGGGARGAGSN